MKKWKNCILLLTLLLFPLFFSVQSKAAQQLPTVAINIPVEKKLTGDKPPSVENFIFILKGEDATTPMPASDSNDMDSLGVTATLTIAGTGTGSFGTIVYAEPNDYHYTITEEQGSAENYTYDSTVYNVTVQITSDDNGALSAQVSMSKDGETGKTDRAVFHNSYKEPEPESSEPSSEPETDPSEPESTPSGEPESTPAGEPESTSAGEPESETEKPIPTISSDTPMDSGIFDSIGGVLDSMRGVLGSRVRTGDDSMTFAIGYILLVIAMVGLIAFVVIRRRKHSRKEK